MNRQKIKKDRAFFYVIQGILLLVSFWCWFMCGTPQFFKVGIIADINQTELRAFDLYKSRLNKYGGIDNVRLKLVRIDKKDKIKDDFIATINLIGRDKYIILNKHLSLPINKELEFCRLNYRMSAINSDCIRKNHKKALHKAINAVKALDIIIESLPERMDNAKQIKDYLSRNIELHPYFDKQIKERIRVKTGIAINKLSKIDMTSVTFQADFFIWFRCETKRGEIRVDDIEFVNTIKPTFLLDSNITNSIINSTCVVNLPNYKRYHIVANFKGLEIKNYALGEQNLPIRIRHRDLSIKDIRYVKDETDKSNGIRSTFIPTKMREWEKIRFNSITNSSLYLNYSLSYATYAHVAKMGNPKTLKNLFIPRSEFTMRYAVKYIAFSLRGFENWMNSFFPMDGSGTIHKDLMLIYISMSLVVFNIITLLQELQVTNGRLSHVAWFAKLIIMMLILLCIEFLLSQLIFDFKNSVWGVRNIDIVNSTLFYLNYSIALLGWIVPAYYIVSAFDQFLWNPIETKTETEIPSVLRMFVAIIVYALTVVGIMAYVFEVTTGSLMATSGAFAILFAILSKVDISNIVAGLGISFAKIFKLGDWVRIDGVEGKVIEMTPRSTKLLTVKNSIVNIPNTDVGSAVIENMTHEDKTAYRVHIHLEIVPTNYTLAEKPLLESVAKINGVLESPKPFMDFLGQGDSAQILELKFYISDYAKKGWVIQSVWREVWLICEQYGIKMSTPQREHFNFEMSNPIQEKN